MSTDTSSPDHDPQAVLDRLSDGVLSLDAEWRVCYANATAAALLGHDPETLRGAVLWSAVPELTDSEFERAIRDAATEGDPTVARGRLAATGTHVSVRAHPDAGGLTVTLHPDPEGGESASRAGTEERETTTDELPESVRPVDAVVVPVEELSALHERESKLERERSRLDAELREVLERVSDAFFALDTDWRFTYVNEQAADLIGNPADDLEGEVVWDVYSEAVGTTFESAYRRAMTEQETVSFVEHYPPLDAWFEVTAYPSETGLSVYFEDVTDRKEREGDLELYETIVETVEDGIYALDEDGRFVFVNQGFCDLTGYDSEELLGEHVTIVKDESVVEQASSLADAIAESDETSMSLDLELHRADGDTVHCETRLRPLATADGRGRCGIVRDITERRARERDLERYRTIVETMDDGVYIVEDGTFTMVNEAYAELVGYSVEELVGSSVSMVVEDEVVDDAMDLETELGHGGASGSRIEASIERPDGTTIEAEAQFALIENEERTERLGVVRDITERKRREREMERGLRRQHLIAALEREALEGADPADLLEEAVVAVAEVLGTDAAEVFELDETGETLHLRSGVGWADDLVGSATVEATADSLLGFTLQSREPVVVDDVDTETRFDVPALFEDRVASVVSFVIGSPSDPWGVLAVHDTERRSYEEQDVSFVQNVSYALETAIDRLEYERDLKRYEAFTRESTDVNAIYDADGTLRYVTPSVEAVLGYTPEEVVGRSMFEVAHPDERDRIEATFETLLENPETTQTVEMRLKHRSGETRVMEVSARNLLDEPLLEGIVTYTRDVTERKQRERALREQRDQLSALAQLNAVVREVNTALVESSSRDELEQRVCERIVAAEPYLFAWVAELDTAASEFVPRASAGPHDGYLEGISLPYAEGDDCGPTCRAHRTGEMQVAHTRTDRRYEAWREDALAHGFEASAAIPIVHGDRQYGVLNVYAGRENAFDDREGEVISNLGETLGHAMSSLERKAALMTDTVTQLELSVPGLGSRVEERSGDADPTVTVERTLDTGDGVYVVYLSTDGLSEEGVRALFGRADDRLLGIRRLDDGDDGDDAGAYEIRVGDPQVLSTVQAYGGSLREMAVRGDDLALLFELPLEENVRPFVDRVTETYPGTSLVRQKQVQRETRSRAEYVSQVVDLLTDKQYQTLETAYFAGYYEWPRRSSASEVAEVLSVSDATISQHFRSGHRKLCSVVFDR